MKILYRAVSSSRRVGTAPCDLPLRTVRDGARRASQAYVQNEAAVPLSSPHTPRSTCKDFPGVLCSPVSFKLVFRSSCLSQLPRLMQCFSEPLSWSWWKAALKEVLWAFPLVTRGAHRIASGHVGHPESPQFSVPAARYIILSGPQTITPSCQKRTRNNSL